MTTKSKMIDPRRGLVPILLVLSASLIALNPAQRISQYAHTSWTRQDGRLQGGVLCVTQTADGMLWIGTEFGLLQFDGVHFTPWRPPDGQQLPNDYVYSLQAARDGTLWIGTRDGLSHWNGARLDNYRTSKGPAGPGVDAIAQDRDGTIWAGTFGYQSGGLCHVDASGLSCAQPSANLPPAISALLEDHQGNLWVGGQGGLARWKPTAAGLIPVQPPLIVSALAEDMRHQIWIATGAEGGLAQLVDGRVVPFALGPTYRDIRPRSLLSDRDGGLWIGTEGQGLLHLRDGRFDKFAQTDGLSNDNVRGLFEDHEGDVWVATDGGLDCFRAFAVANLTHREGLSGNVITSLFPASNGGAWIGTTRGLNRVAPDGSIAIQQLHGPLASSITGIFVEQSGRLWVHSSEGLQYSDGGSFHVLDQPQARGLSAIEAAAEDRDHNLWFSTERGLVHLQSGRIEEILPWSSFGNKHVWAIAADHANGGLWLGFSQGAIAYFRAGKIIQTYGPAEGLAPGAVMDLDFTRDGTLWISTQAGLSSLRNGKLATLDDTNGLPCTHVHATEEDSTGALWLDTACGIVQIAAADLNAWSRNPRGKVRTHTYDTSDGVHTHPTPNGYFSRAGRSADGRIWFATLDSVAIVDPKHLPLNKIPPAVRIEHLTADKQGFPVTSAAQLPPRIKELLIDYAAFSYVEPDKVQFRYKLEGYDTEWKEVGTRRQAIYTNLPPAQYTFHVIACNNDQIWNTEGAVYRFSITPAFSQTKLFWLLCGTAAAALLWGLYKLRLRQIASRMQIRFEARHAERARISGELHDNLLQNLAGFALQLGALSKTVAEPPSARDRLRDLRQQAERWLREARESVWDLRTAPLESTDLLTALRDVAHAFAGTLPVQIPVTAKGTGAALPPRSQEQLLRIVREAIRNALRHAQASEIRIHLEWIEPNLLRLEVRDNGCGFELSEAAQKIGHFGLESMREAAQQIGANVRISTSKGGGTLVEVLAPNLAT